MARFTIGAAVVLLGIASILWSSVPRLWTEYQRADAFVPAQDWRLTNYQCANLKFGLFDRCTVKFVSAATHTTRTIADWRFGPAPAESVTLLQLPDNPSAVTTDVSLRTLSNRMAMIASFALFGVLTLFTLMRKIAQPGAGRRRYAAAR